MLPQRIVKKLQKSKNLLAFSGGGDSTALFYLLLEYDIAFDIAIVDYGVRAQSKEEISYAKELAEKYEKKCYIKTAPRFASNFEANARKIRYTFFEELIHLHGYDTLLTAHHLGDRLEWFMMQLCKGAGCIELSGMQMSEQREHYTLVRPLLQCTKEELLAYLQEKKIRYYHDRSNDDETFLRNRFRHNFAEPLLQEFKEGIRRSFAYMDEDKALLQEECKIVTEGAMSCFVKPSSYRAALICIDKELKKRGYLLSAFEKEQLKKGKNTIVGRRYLVLFHAQLACIAPYSDEKPTLPKKFKEECRKLSIEPKLRAFLYENPSAFEVFKNLIQAA